MKKILYLFIFLPIFCCFSFFWAPERVCAEFAQRPVAFVVLDASGAVDASIYKAWRAPVKWAYHFPDYKIFDDSPAQQLASSSLRQKKKIDAAAMASLAMAANVDVLVLVRVYEMQENIVSSFFMEDETRVLVTCYADLVVYKKEGGQFREKRLREREIKDLGNYEKPEETIKWQLANLINKLEGRPLFAE